MLDQLNGEKTLIILQKSFSSLDGSFLETPGKTSFLRHRNHHQSSPSKILFGTICCYLLPIKVTFQTCNYIELFAIIYIKILSSVLNFKLVF